MNRIGGYMEYKKTYINGCWVDGNSDKELKAVNPSNGEVIAVIKENNLDDVKSDGDPRVNFTCSGNKCTAQSESNAYLGLYIQNNSIIVENNDGTLYSKEVDSRVKVNSLTGSNNGDYIYFQIKCTNIFSDEDYNINIVIYNG